MDVFGFNITAATQILESSVLLQQFYTVVSRTYLELFIFTVGLFIYAFFVWHFYKNLAKRDLFALRLDKYDFDTRWRRLKKGGSVLAYILKYLIVFPLYTSFWFAVLALFLFILAKEIEVYHIILVSIILISTIRATAYYKEELAGDLAKLLPFALLAVALIDPNFFELGLFYTRLEQLPALTSTILRFLSFTIVFEWILRILYSIKCRIIENSETETFKREKRSFTLKP